MRGDKERDALVYFTAGFGLAILGLFVICGMLATIERLIYGVV